MFEPITFWYSGKALETLRNYVLPTLGAAKELGYWPAGVSRKVCAALNKQAVAMRFGREHEDVLRRIEHKKENGWYLAHAMQFGSFMLAPKNVELAARLHSAVSEDQSKAYAVALKWAQEFKPVAELVTLLNDTRPKPVYVMKTLSPTVFRNVGLAMGLELSTIRMPEIKWTWVEVEVKGKTYRMPHGEILWPKGTKHWSSRYAQKSADQCHACGHVIHNRFNWVPLVAESGSGPLSMWVGKDCAGKLFGCQVTGEATYKRE